MENNEKSSNVQDEASSAINSRGIKVWDTEMPKKLLIADSAERGSFLQQITDH